MLRYEHIKKYALDAGFTLCGVARARVLEEHAGRFEAGMAASGDGALEYLARHQERRLDPGALLKGARTVVVCALAYPRVDYPAGFEGDKMASFALVEEDYHGRIKKMLREMLSRLREEVPALRAKVCCDTSPILEKAWAVEAGLGWQGRNSLLVNPVHGSFLSLGELVLDTPCDCYDEPYSGSGCGVCRACIAACPVGALGEAPGGIRTLDTGRCISARTVELGRLDPDAPREAIHGWIYGCDECQTVCPYNKKRPISCPDEK